MKSRTFKILGLVVAVGLFVAPSLWAGTITGNVKCKGVRSSQWAIVYVDAISGKDFIPPQEMVTMDQTGKEFIPHVLPILKGTTVNFFNNDPFLHNVFSPDEAADEFNLGSWGQGGAKPYTFTKLGEAVMLCDLHPEMEGWVVVLPTPYFAVTDVDGNYTIENVPEGSYTLKTWHKKLKPGTSDVVVSASGSVSVDFLIKK